MTYPEINPVAFGLGPVQVQWYGLMYVIGIGAAWILGNYRAGKPGSGWTREEVGDMIFYGALGVILGGRFGYVLFYQFDQFLANPLWLLKIWTGGMSFHGGLLGVIVAFWLFARKTGRSFFQVSDYFAPMVPIGLATGRLGNFINGELWGRASDVNWAMVFPADPLQIARHPSQLYQFALEGVLLLIVLWWYSSKPRPLGAITGLFGLGYGVARIVAEFFREPDAHLGYLIGDWFTMGMLLSLPMVFIGAAMMAWGYRQQPTGKV